MFERPGLSGEIGRGGPSSDPSGAAMNFFGNYKGMFSEDIDPMALLKMYQRLVSSGFGNAGAITSPDFWNTVGQAGSPISGNDPYGQGLKRMNDVYFSRGGKW